MVAPHPHFDLAEYILNNNILVQEIVPRTVVFPSTDRRRSAELYEFRCRARRI